MSRKNPGCVISCYQCAGISFCYGTKSPGITREQGRNRAESCISLRKGTPRETVAVFGYQRGLSRANAEKLTLNGFARWVGLKTIEPVTKLPLGIHNRLQKEEQKQQGEMMVIG